MKYWKYVDLENWETICKGVYAFSKAKGHVNTALFWNELNIQELMTAVPVLEESLAKLDVKCTYAAILVAHMIQRPIIHIDEMALFGTEARLQLPIANCDRSWTMFYEMPTQQMDRKIAKNGVVHFEIPPGSVKEVDRVRVDRPTVLRISHPHAVRTGPIGMHPRMTLTLRLDKDPVRWLDADN